MQWDYHAWTRQRFADKLDAFARAARRTRERELGDTANLLANGCPHLAYLYCKAIGNEDAANAIRSRWKPAAGRVLEGFDFLPDASLVASLPRLSFFIRIPFKLEKPYISRDDCIFHLLENPVRRDRTFGAPVVGASTWKGAFRAALWQLGYREEHPGVVRLLGTAADEGGQAGRLQFFSTFFKSAGLDVINPHDRETGVGRRPILLECVPKGEQGELALAYVPFGESGPSDQPLAGEVADDLPLVATGVEAMLRFYGFGAKATVGFGTVEDGLAGEGTIILNAFEENVRGEPESADKPKGGVGELARYLEAPGRLHRDLRREDGSLKSEDEYRAFLQSQGRQFGKADRQLYEKAKKWWEREGKISAAGATSGESMSPEACERSRPLLKRKFTSLSEFVQTAEKVSLLLRAGGAV